MLLSFRQRVVGAQREQGSESPGTTSANDTSMWMANPLSGVSAIALMAAEQGPKRPDPQPPYD